MCVCEYFYGFAVRDNGLCAFPPSPSILVWPAGQCTILHVHLNHFRCRWALLVCSQQVIKDVEEHVHVVLLEDQRWSETDGAVATAAQDHACCC